MNEHSELKELRELFIKIGHGIRPDSYEEGEKILNNIYIKKEYNPDLQKALNLIKNNIKPILAYKKLNVPYPETRLRVNNEWHMRRGRRILKLRYGLKNVFKKAYLLSQKFGIKIKVSLKCFLRG